MRSICALSVLVPAVSLASDPAVDGAIFGFTDSQGVTHYSNVPADDRFKLVLTPPKPDEPPHPAGALARSDAYAHIIKGAATANRLEPALVRAVIVAESGGDPQAVSKRGARGLMQLMPET